MNAIRFTAVGLCALAGLVAACSHKQDAETGLENAAAVLAQGEHTPAAPAPEPQAEAQAVSASPSEPPAPPIATPSQQMRQALVSYKAGQLEDAVTRLQKLRAMPTLTAQQRMAVQDGVAAVMNEVYQMAAKGDTRALAAVKQYEQINSTPRR